MDLASAPPERALPRSRCIVSSKRLLPSTSEIRELARASASSVRAACAAS